jgi:hypothetical protein
MTGLLTLIIAITDILLLSAGVLALVQFVAGNINSLFKALLASLIIVALLSDFYYLMLLTGLDFSSLLVILLVLNMVHAWKSIPVLFRNCLSSEVETRHLLLIMLPVLAATAFFMLHGSKYGSYDAWATWNLHARFLYNDHEWQNLFFAGRQLQAHSDYPLMVPAFVAFIWKSLGSTTFIVPMLFAFIQALAIPLMVYAALAEQNRIYAFFGLLIFFADSNYLSYTDAQCADMLMALFILASVVLLVKLREGVDYGIATVLGFIAASTTWIKNEGDLFFVVLCLLVCLNFKKDLTVLKRFFLGAAFPLLITISFKMMFAPSNDLVYSGAHNTGHLIAQVLDLSRYFYIAKAFGVLLTYKFTIGLILVIVMCLFERRALITPAFILLFLTFGGYLLIYLLTPYDLRWHVSLSMDRLIMHLYPSFIFLSLYHLAQSYPIQIAGQQKR